MPHPFLHSGQINPKEGFAQFSGICVALLVVLLPVFSLFFEQFFMMLPWHVCLLLFVWLTVALARGALGVVFGKEAAGHILGCAVVSVVRLIGGLGAGLIHLVAWLGFGALRVLIPSTRR